MQTAIICLLILSIIPITMSWVSGYYRHKQFNMIDNKMPRVQASNLEGAGHCAVAAQQNAWEGLAVYAAALLAMFMAGVDLETVSTLLIVLVVCRVLHAVCYLINQDIVRSLAFLGAYGICMYFFYLAIAAA